MTEAEIFNALFGGGNFTLPFLLKFTHPTAGKVCLINDNKSLTFESNTYEPANFTYNPPDNTGSNANLEISSVPNENNLFEFIENSDYKYRLDVVGALLEDGIVQKIKLYSHFYGSVSVDKAGKINFTLGEDDRKDMTFTPYVFDTDNNPGNA